MSMLTSALTLLIAIHLPPDNFAYSLLKLLVFFNLALTLLSATFSFSLAHRKKMNSAAQIVHFRAHYFAIRFPSGLITDLHS
jgi:hypothetical protein